MITKHDDLLGTLIHDVAHLLRLEIDQRVESKNLTRTKWLALGIIDANPGLSQSELAIELELGAAAVGRLVDRLVARNFVERRSTDSDRRAYQLYLTRDARKLITKLDGVSAQLRKDVLRGLEDEDVSRLTHGLQQLKKNLQAQTLPPQRKRGS